MGHLADIITYAKFQVEIFRGYDFTGGRIFHFPIDFCMDLTTVQRDCAACDVRTQLSHNPGHVYSAIKKLYATVNVMDRKDHSFNYRMDHRNV